MIFHGAYDACAGTKSRQAPYLISARKKTGQKVRPQMSLYSVQVVRRQEGKKPEIKILFTGLTREEAKNAQEDWLKIFNPEVYHDPVPEVVIKKDSSDSDGE